MLRIRKNIQDQYVFEHLCSTVSEYFRNKVICFINSYIFHFSIFLFRAAMFYKEFGVCLSEPALRTALVAINDLGSNYMRGKIDSKQVSRDSNSQYFFNVFPLQIKTRKQYPVGIQILKVSRRSNQFKVQEIQRTVEHFLHSFLVLLMLLRGSKYQVNRYYKEVH